MRSDASSSVRRCIVFKQLFQTWTKTSCFSPLLLKVPIFCIDMKSLCVCALSRCTSPPPRIFSCLHSFLLSSLLPSFPLLSLPNSSSCVSVCFACRQKKTDVRFLIIKKKKAAGAGCSIWIGQWGRGLSWTECFSPQTDKSHVYFTEKKGDKEVIFELCYLQWEGINNISKTILMDLPV